jgi:hypothetical protein
MTELATAGRCGLQTIAQGSLYCVAASCRRVRSVCYAGSASPKRKRRGLPGKWRTVDLFRYQGRLHTHVFRTGARLEMALDAGCLLGQLQGRTVDDRAEQGQSRARSE